MARAKSTKPADVVNTATTTSSATSIDVAAGPGEAGGGEGTAATSDVTEVTALEALLPKLGDQFAGAMAALAEQHGLALEVVREIAMTGVAAGMALQQTTTQESMVTDLSGRLNRRLDEAAAERGMSRDELAAQIHDFLSRNSPHAATAEDGGSRVMAGPTAGLPPERSVRVTVTGPQRGRRRAGRDFGSDPQTIDVTTDELKLIEGDPTLSLT